MKVILQRALRASVSVDGEVCGRCMQGLLLLVGVGRDDAEDDALLLARKILSLRIFSDADGKMNLSVRDVGGGILAISNFTLYASARRGNRPDFQDAAPPDKAERLYDLFCSALGEEVPVEKGVFGADMKIDSIADGPVTVILDSEVLKGPRRG